MVYEFLYFFRGSSQPACERRTCPADAVARVRAAEELLRMPSRVRVEVWCTGRLVYYHDRAPCGRRSAA
jgi:hypothetical protein